MSAALRDAMAQLSTSGRVDGTDRYMVELLAGTEVERWTDAYLASARQKAAKYGLSTGYPHPASPGRPKTKRPATKRPAKTRKRGGFVASFAGAYVELRSDGWPGQAAVSAVKEIPGAIFLESPAKHWRVAASAAASKLLEHAAAGIVHLDAAGEARLRKTLEAQRKAIEASASLDARVQVDGLGGELRTFQRAGVLYFDETIDRPQGILADDMGLGKTVQSLAILKKRNAFPAVVVCPASLKLQWEREVGFWLTGLRGVEVLSGMKPRPLDPRAGIVIVNYDILSAWTDALRKIKPRGVIFDECHKLKNYRAVRSKAALRLTGSKIHPEVILGLTGTPVETTPAELMNQLRVVRRLDDFGGYRGFTGRYLEKGPWGGWGGAKNTQELNARLRATCYLRRDKPQVLRELPGKQRVKVPIELNRAERKAYDELVDEVRRDQARAMVELRRAEEEGREPEGWARAAAAIGWGKVRRGLVAIKMRACIDWIEVAMQGGARPLVFAHHKALAVEPLAKALKVPAIYGNVPVPKRQAIVDRFESGGLPALVLNDVAGSVGLNLTSTSQVVFVELPLTPGTLNQAEDRSNRMGQKLKVTAYQLLATSTLDDVLSDALAVKERVAGEITDGTAAGRKGVEASIFKTLYG